MKDKIIALLTAKFAGAQKTTLGQLARALAMQATTEEEVQGLVDAITAEQVTEFEREYNADVDKRVTDGVKKNEKTLKEKYDFVEKKKQEPANPNPKPEDDEVPGWAKAILESNKKLSEEIGAFKTGETRKNRKQTLEKAIEGASEKVRAKILKDFDFMNFDSDESFDAYVESTKTDITDIAQEYADQGLGSTERPKVSKGAPSKQASDKELDAVMANLQI